MIGMLRGRVWEIQGNGIILDVQGIGYEMTVPYSLLSRLKAGQEVTLYTKVIVREDDLSLYGFSSAEEKGLFLDLLNVSGIGPKAGMAILSTFGAGQVETAIAMEDVTMLTKVPGIGKKTAQRLVLELKEKYKGLAVKADSQEIRADYESSDVLDTLMALGYGLEEGMNALKKIAGEGDLTVEEQIKKALRLLSARS